MIKSNLIDIVAGTNRGLLVNAAQQQAILAAIANLEDFNPTPRPLASNLLEGDWRLLYTTSKALLKIDRLPFFQLGQIYQCIRVETNSVYNIAEIYGIPALEGLVSVVAQFTPLSPSRLQVKFQRSIIGFQRLIGYTTPGNFVQQIESGHFQNKLAFDFPIQSQQQQAWLDITYLDDDLRIARGNEGNVFVLSKT
ncbi:PAP/fibrillin family protein [Dolichospermum circinale]|uniref:PAP/fibrillin family protein n=1 Tax=Dolichospermum circinale TaxID=109265 RepID=UPI0004197A1C|nr:PAP/fibrillin family protein [Dolichospermum circinale]MDB9474718.1 PAP/fibrillin family protein [Dolichospermum circinale CS-537/11]MDB9477886.1 PAP/fibrillin family protein [Dolichospermum circinale CS-537/03]MDB9483819.1 PAP/fibrillin family protein [Dolichospermum circinale CS-537/05]